MEIVAIKCCMKELLLAHPLLPLCYKTANRKTQGPIAIFPGAKLPSLGIPFLILITANSTNPHCEKIRKGLAFNN